MGARNKLNGIYIKVAAVVGAVVGILCSSLTVAIIVFAGIIGLALYTGGIRPRGGGRGPHLRP